ncbi:unnamed protein product, partial [Adineta steineri]
QEMEKRFNNNIMFAKSTIEFKQNLADVVNDNAQLPPLARVPTQNPTAFTINDREKLMCSLILASRGNMQKKFMDDTIFAKSTCDFHRNFQHIVNANPAPTPQQININSKKR